MDPTRPNDGSRRRPPTVPTPLPPISQLLPDPGSSGPSRYNYLSHPQTYPTPSGSNTHTHTPMAPPSDSSTNQPFHDSDEGGDRSDQAPPKKRRRRQALSCTECKRRKIKCDREHPCGPCVRRNEQDKCEWHKLEPVEKYVTRTEYDELRRRFDRLESIVHRLDAENKEVGETANGDRLYSGSYSGRERSGSGSVTASSFEYPRGIKFEAAPLLPDPLLSPRTRPHGSSSPYRPTRMEPYERPIRHRESHERSPSGGSTKGILTLLRADAEIAERRLFVENGRSPSPVAVRHGSPSSRSISSLSSVGDEETLCSYRSPRQEPFPPHYVRPTCCRDDCCETPYGGSQLVATSLYT